MVTPRLSQIGERMSQLTGVRAIMKDIIETLANTDVRWINLSAGNPLILPEVEQMWRDYTAKLLSEPAFGEALCRYGSSQGYEPFIEVIADHFRQTYGWNVTPQNVLVTPGSQSLYFFAANSFGGVSAIGDDRSILLPLSPDYTGYNGASLNPDALVALQPTIQHLRDHRFKYVPKLDRLQLDKSIGAILFSRPCNPSGNVMATVDVRRIADRATQLSIPVLIDSAYAPPFPNLVFQDMDLVWGDTIIHCMSLSKAGLPGERLGVAIGAPELLAPLQAFQANATIHSSRFGQAIAAKAIASGQLATLAKTVIQPHYHHKRKRLEAAFDREMPQDIPWHLHVGEGGIFAWLWLQDCPHTDTELYQVIKKEGTIVVPGQSFFPGLRDHWAHTRQCLRISLTASVEDIEAGVAAIARAVTQAYNAEARAALQISQAT
ncbi:MAG: valine--pyruvate transaminase [Cyanobacteria bacterium P01_E01_bin.34]